MMSMTYDEKDLDKAIENDNKLWIKGTVMNCMWNDPAFEHGETEALLETLNKRIPSIFVPYEKVPSEERLERSAKIILLTLHTIFGKTLPRVGWPISKK